jgi:hypothetical protein
MRDGPRRGTMARQPEGAAMRRLWAASLTLTLVGWTGLAVGQDRSWQPAPAVSLGPPVAVLGSPRPAAPVARGQSPDDGVGVSQWAAALTEPNGGSPAIAPLQLPGTPYTPYTPVSATVEYPPASLPSYAAAGPPSASYPPAPIPPSPDDALGTPKKSSARKTAERRTGRQSTSRFGEWMQDYNPFHEGCFESDHCFDYFISPVSNPFLFEDPRSLTEVRPIFTYQTIPDSNPLFRGGNAEFFGLQARLAITDQWSLVINKLGGVSINPGGDSPLPGATGFSEFWLGPKWTFLRSPDTGTVAAAGVTFQIPTGPPKVYQDTGKLSVTPYVTAAQNFGCTQYGSFNVMDTLGYTFRADSDRSDYFFNSIHLDFDVCNWHRVYPLIELNWFHYTRAGDARDFGTEGRDLANIGSTGVSGRDNLTIAVGTRYKFSECVQTGIALEFPLNGTRDLLDFRLGMDLIFRY